jgi:glyoxylase-like metal-dependent hydrolase (beta-lactamase superfamily II)
MDLKIITSGPFATNAYIYSNPESREAVIIDAPPESFASIQEALKGLTPVYLLLTHSHWDHTADAPLLKKAYPNMKVAVHEKDIGNVEHPGSDGLPVWINIPTLKPDLLLKEGDTLFGMEVIETPGHTPGGVCFYDAPHKILFSGDTLFQGTIGNLSFPTARPELMWKSLKKLAKLPSDVIVYPGHGGRTAIGQENWLDRAEQIFG